MPKLLSREVGVGGTHDGLLTSPGFRLGDPTKPSWTAGNGTPEGAVSAPVGSMFSRTDGSTDTAVYRKETGTGNSGWVAVASSAGGAGGVTSVDGRTGDVTLADRYVNVTGDAMTGNLAIGGSTYPDAALNVGATLTDGYPRGISTVGLTLVPESDNDAYAMQLNATINARAGYTVASTFGLLIPGMNKAGTGTIARAFGAYINPPGIGTQDFGVAIAKAKTATLVVGADGDYNIANAGIMFGQSRDTSLFRSGANQLRTMSTFVSDGWMQSDVGFRLNVTGLPQWRGGPGDPEGAVTAAIGSLWSRTDGGAGTALYRKESDGTGNTGWVPVASSAGGVTSVDGRTGVVALSDLYVDVAGDNMTGNLGLGFPSPTAKLQFAANTTPAGGILFGTDTNLYRSAADTLTTDDTFISGAVVQAALSTTAGGFRQGASGPTWTAGTGAPNGVVSAPVGSMYSQTNGAADTALYRKEVGAGNTGWVAVSAAPALTWPLDAPDSSGDKILWWGTTYRTGMAGLSLFHEVPSGGSLHEFRTGGTWRMQIGDSSVNLNAGVSLSVNGTSLSSSTASVMTVGGALSVTGLGGAGLASRYVGATASGAPAAGTFAVGDYVVDRSGAMWICTAAGTPGTWTKVGSSATQYVQLAGDTMTGNLSAPTFTATGLAASNLASRYVGAVDGAAPAFGSYLKGDFAIDRSGAIWVCNTSGSSGFWTKIGGTTVAAHATTHYTGGTDPLTGRLPLAISSGTVVVGGGTTAPVGGNYSTIIGYSALKVEAAGAERNTVMGYEAMTNMTTGTNNTSIGMWSGGGITTGVNNVMIGVSTTSAAGADGAVAVGFGAQTISGTIAVGKSVTALYAGSVGIGGSATAVNDFVLGVATNLVRVPGTLGVGTVPAARLHLAADTTATGGIQFGADTNLYRSAANVLTTDDTLTSAAVVQAALGTAGGFRHGATGPVWLAGTGAPEGVVAAPIGSIYSRTDGSTNLATYRKEGGAATTGGWVADSAGGAGITWPLDAPDTSGDKILWWGSTYVTGMAGLTLFHNVPTGGSLHEWQTGGTWRVRIGDTSLTTNTGISLISGAVVQAASGTTGGFRQGAAGPLWLAGTGIPEGVVTAPVGSIFSRTDGAANTAIYRKETGTGASGWVAAAGAGSHASTHYEGGSDPITGRLALSFGSNNVVLGASSMPATTGYCTAVGNPSLKSQQAAGYSNTAIGYDSLPDVTTGIQNTGLGVWAGKGLTTGNNNVAIGWTSSVAASSDGAIAIGYNTSVTASSIAIGKSVTALWSNSVGIGGSAAAANDFCLGTSSHNVRIPGNLAIVGSYLGSLTLNDGVNIAVGTTTGTKIGTAITQKLGFWNAPPVIQNTGWSITAGYTPDKAFNPEATTLTEVARALGTLVDTLKAYGLLG